MRPIELLGAQWENVDWQQAVITRPRKRQARPQPIPLTPPALDLLRTLPSYHASGVKLGAGALFPDIPYHRLRDAWRRMQARTGLHDLRAYDLRHSRLSQIGEAGLLTLKEFQSVSGHQTVEMLLRYWHADANVVRNKLSQIGSGMPSLGKLKTAAAAGTGPADDAADDGTV